LTTNEKNRIRLEKELKRSFVITNQQRTPAWPSIDVKRIS